MRRKESGAVTAADIAALCGVSQGTVDRALHGRGEIRPETKERILKVAAEYGYRPNISAQRLAGGKSGLVGVVLFDLKNAYFSELVMHLEESFRAVDLLPVLMFSGKDPATERQCIQRLCAMGVEGIVLLPVGNGVEYERELASLPVPVVTVGNRLGALAHIGIDDRRAMCELALRMMERGYARYLYYAPVLAYGDANKEAQEARYQGFLDAAAQKGITPETVCENDIDPTKIPADALVMASTDYYALRLIYAGVSAKQVTGFDHIALAEDCRVPLTTVDGNSRAVARALAAFFAEAGKTGVSVTVPHELIFHE